MGFSNIAGGFIGLLLGANIVNAYKDKIRNAYFFFPAIFMAPAAGFAFLALSTNIPALAGLSYCLMALCIYTHISPMGVVSVSAVPAYLRSRAVGAQICIHHILGDVISPPLIGYISDTTGSLRTALEILPFFLVATGGFWFMGFFFVKPLESLKSKGDPTKVLL